jgi:guanosine-3',5'-bis(diphosphate) 3'-pyrophosphohydrolase
MSELRLMLEAVAFAAHQHRDQRRKDAGASPYINHPIAVAQILASAGVEDVDVLRAAVLHDVIEDTECSLEEMATLFGSRVAGIVSEVTNDKTLSKAEVKLAQIAKAPHMSVEAKLVKLADKICNLTDILTHPPTSWPLERKQAYFESSAKVVDGLRGADAGLEARVDALLGRRVELL